MSYLIANCCEGSASLQRPEDGALRTADAAPILLSSDSGVEIVICRPGSIPATRYHRRARSAGPTSSAEFVNLFEAPVSGIY